jgi:glucuronoarabinoxylan endo-1,4-beta-xylanase
MVRFRRIALLCVEVFVCSCIKRGAPSGAPEEGARSALVTLSPAERHQTLEGFGASIAFQIERAVGNPPHGLYQALFPDLGLDVLRFRNRYQRSERDDRDLAQEVEILRRATQALGYRPKVMLSSWSPPAILKANRAERCRGNADCTLKKVDGRFVYGQFADYWYDSLKRYASLGIEPDYVTIQNEPDFIPPDWEGCKFEPTETAVYPGYDRALEAVYQRVSTLPTSPKLLGPEVVGVHNNKVQNYTKAMNLDLVYGVAHHLYEKGDDGVWDWRTPGPDSYVEPMKGAAKAAGAKPLFQTEFQTDEDHGTDGGFETAWLIHNSLVEESVAAFFYWDLVWQPKGGLVSVEGARYTLRDQYYSMKHYARYTDPGDVRIGARADSGDIKVSAFLSTTGSRMTVVVLNVGRQQIDARLDLGGFGVDTSAIFRTTYRPGASEVWSELGALPATGVVPLPPRSVATVVLTGHP